MNIKQIQEARESFGIDDWGAGYYGIDDRGNVVVHPDRNEENSVPLPEVVEEVKDAGLKCPLIIRFPQIVEKQLELMHKAFRDSIWEYEYRAKHFGVFPFKVNQRKEFIDTIAAAGKRFDYGLEVGSKTEFIAALSYNLSPKALLICNGFKDAEFIEMGFIASAMGKNVVLVVEGPDELQTFVRLAKDATHIPDIGLRVRLYSKGSGKWEKSSGDTSKFGLTTSEVLQALELIESARLQKHLTMLHFHIGSQITQIKRFKNALKEASRVYAKIYKMGFRPKYLNIGGGVGVDYDGSKTSFQSSANYSLQEFANDAVYVIGDVCNNEEVPHPNIVTESGRVIAAYHSVVVTDIREAQGTETTFIDLNSNIEIEKIHTKPLRELYYIYENMNKKNFSEYYHDSAEFHEELFTLFNLGYIDLRERAMGEELFQAICRKALYFSTFQPRELEEFDHLQRRMVTKYLANFSIFQSIPDTWSIDQLFPVMPISRHDEKPSHKGTIVDITCDSDGCLDRFIDKREIKPVLDLHTPDEKNLYYIGFFLVGAYQESLANEHNLFGAINEAEVVLDKDGSWKISKLTKGDPICELLESRNYNLEEIVSSYQDQLERSEKLEMITSEISQKLLERLKEFTGAYPYLGES